MSMAVDYRPQQALGGMGYDSKYSQPHFNNPWGSSAPGSSPSSLYHPSHYQQSPTSLEHPQVSKAQSQMSMGYVANPAASSLGSELVPSRSYGSAYSSAPTSQPSYTATASARYSPEQVSQNSPYGYDSDLSRRSSYQASNSSSASYSDEIASAHGMVAMASGHDMTTPRNIYGTSHVRGGSSDSYGFPSSHSQHSSISSASAYPYYSSSSYNGSVDGSATDYSSASEDVMVPRTLPAPGHMLGAGEFGAPEPQAMMSQFNAKMSPSAQKKHKCKICEKRFTRPSSLQTHMFSHTGEKPFACDHDGCGRHFSVVSNLRRHKKVHKEGSDSVSGADDE